MKATKRSLACLLAVALLAAGLAAPLIGQAAPTTSAAAAPGLLQFTAGGHVLGFTPQAAWLTTGSHALRVGFADANAVTPISDTPAAPGGQAVPLGRVTYANLWDGISLTYEAVDGAIAKSTYHLAPGADPAQIRLPYNVPVQLAADGSLSLAFATGRITESAPVAWQETDADGQRVPVAAAFQVRGQTVSFSLGDYDPRRPLTIDPNYHWHTFYGSGSNDEGYAIAADGSGNVYVAGRSAANWQGEGPTNPIHAYSGGNDITVLKLDSDGAYVWHTFYGSISGDDGGYGIVTNGSDVYVAGYSGASWQGDGVSGPTDPIHTHSGSNDIAVLKLTSDGAYQWHTFYGSGSSDDCGRGIVLDSSSNVYVAGYSNATWDGPLPGDTPLHDYTGDYDIAVLKLTNVGTYEWHTFYGSSTWDYGRAIAVDGSDNVYVAGYSRGTWDGPNLTDTPIHAYSGNNDIAVLKLENTGAYRWHTFYGSAIGQEYGHGIAVDGSDVYVAGRSSDTWDGPDGAAAPPLHTHSGDYDITVLKLDNDGGYQWHTFYGSGDGDYGEAIAVDGSGGVYVAGYSSTTWQGDGATNPIHAHSGTDDVAVLKLDSDGTYRWHTFYGSNFGVDEGYGIVANGSGTVYVTGRSGANWNGDGGALPRHAYTGGYDITVLRLAQSATAMELASLSARGAAPGAALAMALLGTLCVMGLVAGVALVRRRR
ncbi:MAG: SBBP repeat-containing protein [Chloroflexi bacterium]|nr:SBBP repeat-containing protein [Chloroflexota bacterium]MBU1748072.1 SBBP repeat-containing protein [Chloroflexota bacterium]